MTVRVTKVDAELYSTLPHVILKPIRITKVDAELYSTLPHVILKPIRITKVDAELYSTLPHVILKPIRVTKVDTELYSATSWSDEYNEIPSGGAIIAGSSNVYVSLNLDATGGITGGSTAQQTPIYNIETSGGINSSGDGSTLINYNVDVNGGIVSSSASEPLATYNLTVENYGIVIGGISEAIVVISNIATGGIILSGESEEVFADTIEANGGVTSSGSSILVSIYNIDPTYGSLASGSSQGNVVNEETSTGGIVASSSSEILFSHNPSIENYGIVIGGVSGNTVETSNVATGGIILSGNSYIPGDLPIFGGIVGEGSAFVSVIHSIEFDGGSIVTGYNQNQLFLIPNLSGSALVSGNPTYNLIIAEYTSVTEITLSGNSIYGKLYSNEMISGISLSGSNTTNLLLIAPVNGGSIVSGHNENYTTYNSVSDGGVKLAGHGATIETEFASGGILAGGQYITRYLVDYPSGGLSIGGQSLVVSEHIWIKVDNCGSDLKCGYSNDDQFCAGFDKIQSFGSKFVNPKRKDNAASLISKKPLYGTTAYVPAITFCHQKIRIDAEDMPPKRIITSEVPVETINDEDIQLNMMSISMPITGSEIKSIKPKKIVQKNLNTPQMAALKKLSNSTKKTTFIHEPIAKGHKRVQKTQRPRLDAL